MAHVMVMGTSSHVGKSVIVAGLLRHLAQRGVTAAPFKAQNMSLNATVTPDGREIAWSQALQAEAAGIPPSADMNPILLKPSAESRSQLVVQGRALGDVEARDYFRDDKRRLWAAVKESYRRLSEAYPVLVLEGAGSPAEMNLKAHDISNMRAAELADAWVLLVADIERGGVFAAVWGTLQLLEPRERARVAGVIINKFRGDPTLFADGVQWLETHCGVPVWGVLPHLGALDLDEEDSLGLTLSPPAPDAVLTVAAVRLPHLANFNDVDPLMRDPRLSVRWCSRPADLEGAHVVVLPGTKNTMEDLAWLHASGLAAAIRRLVDQGASVLGICGGFQMLGHAVEDPEHVESSLTSAPGLDLLDQVTTLTPEKATVRVTATLAPPFPASPVFGYELHMGRTRAQTAVPPLCRVGDREEGAIAADGRVIGTYLHGLLENHAFREPWLAQVAVGQGADWPSLATMPAAARRRAALDRLAEALRQHLDLSRLDNLLATRPPVEPSVEAPGEAHGH
jgi:adenosylcobyric acid synthase